MESGNRIKYIIAAVAFIILLVAIYFLFIFQKSPSKPKSSQSAQEVKELTEVELAKRPYVTLTPTADGAEIIISIENMAFFDRIEYELTYMADNPSEMAQKIQRGSTGSDVNTHDQKYKKSMLLGTASRGVRSPDTGITDGKLTVHMFRGETEFLSETNWNLTQIGATAAALEDSGGNIKLELSALGKNYWVILTQTIGLPLSLPFDLQKVKLPIWGFFSVAPEFSKKATLALKETESSSKLYMYTALDSRWQLLSTPQVPSFGTFVVVAP